MKGLGAEVSYHKFHSELNKFHPLHFFFWSELDLFIIYGINAVGIIRAPCGDGKEAIVLATPDNSLKISLHSQHGEYAAVDAWHRDYRTPTPLFGGLAKQNTDQMCHESSNLYELKKNLVTGADVSDVFRRGGTMAAALVVKVADISEEVERET
ncbi:hypothetical protein Vadar_027756 [Vaccinium darrowii]|uniref:Uncharacterized protein n=1 Tax=Vaccinium darrowii TaxID=229202 RepID=A0ACB7XKG7_9ERIC|nr:hypothetical protein Vadar_027756 [Vaccinium darrowii]